MRFSDTQAEYIEYLIMMKGGQSAKSRKPSPIDKIAEFITLQERIYQVLKTHEEYFRVRIPESWGKWRKARDSAQSNSER